MNRLILLPILLFNFAVHAQLSITQSDLPSVGDTLRYTTVSNPFFIQPGAAGANVNWNFSQLTGNSQFLEHFQPLNQQNFLYQFAFGTFSSNPSSFAKPEPNALALPAQAFISIDNQVNFYQLNASAFRQVGIGAELNNFPVPIVYSQPDRIFKFPLQYQNQDSANFAYNVDIPGFAYYGRSGKRANKVDGFGTLTTPFGQFNCLRIKSTVTARDTFFLDTLGGISFALDIPREINYYWLAAGQKYPLLHIVANQIPIINQEQVIRIAYRDQYKPTSVATINASKGILVYPNPAQDALFVQHRFGGYFAVINTLGETMMQGTLDDANSRISIATLKPGAYAICILSNDQYQRYVKWFVKQ